ncbi:glycosyltransferase [Curtobacterium sp. MCSS17_015]|uniref:glycosyltransferase n=1 Tax=Curtobacterium sp. MCSS17_015 TaxID=2175666 RepID=UPI0024DFF0E3|nr:glycosyltransferase [Curtobacterium sp. MCSS17_015]WIB27715.1 glycosyltransferase [Curtobacterium sp. MCSS17_015]
MAIIGTRGYPSSYGGFETAVRYIAPYLADHGWDVTVYGRPGTTSEELEADERIGTVTTRGVQSKSLSTLSFGLTSSLHALWKRPDVALVMNVANGFWLPLLRARGIRTVVNVDGIEWERAKWGRLARTTFRTGARFTARWATEIIVDAKAIGAHWLEDFGRAGHFIPYGGEAKESTDPAPLPKGTYVLVVARFVPENTIAEFFEAAPALAETHEVVMVGSTGFGGDLDDRARQLAEQHPRISWLGHVSDDDLLHALWADAGAYFHGHSVGGTNPALVQAMALGAPVVARDTLYNREVLGEEAEFTDPDAASIVTSIRSVLADPQRRAALSTSAKRRAAEVYTWEKVCAAYEQLLRAQCGPGRPTERDAVDERAADDEPTSDLAQRRLRSNARGMGARRPRRRRVG